MNNIKVSILVPICNVEKYLDKCLQSIIKQSLNEIEIVCINDGSKDNSLEIIKKYAQNDNRIIIIDKANTGYGDSMNQGLRIAKGEYIGIVESDDFIDGDMFRKLYENAKKYNADIVKSNFYFYWENPLKLIYKNNLKIKSILLDTEICRRKLFLGMPAIWSAIYKNDWLKKEKIEFLPTPGASYQDISFRFKSVALAQKIVLIPEALLYYRQDNPNSSVKSTAMDKIYLNHKEYDEIKKFIKERNLWKFNKYFCNKLLSACALNYGRIDKVYRKDYYNFFINELKIIDRWEIDYIDLPTWLRYGGYFAIKNNFRILLDFMIKLKKIKEKIF